jgi:preprotein translocase subunit SecE
VNRLQRLKQFFVDVVSELKKTSWPSRKEVYGTTAVVILTVLICSVYLFLVDSIIGKTVDLIFSTLNG